MMKRKQFVSLLVAVLLLLGAIFAFSSCRSGSKVDYNIASEDYDDGSDTPSVRRYLTRILKADATAHEYFIAATRGYNMLAEGFDDSKVNEKDGEENGMPRTEGTNRDAIRDIFLDFEKKATKSDSKSILNNWASDTEAALSDAVIEQVVSGTQEEVALENDTKGLGWIMYGIGRFLGWMTSATGGYYAISIFFFALLIKVVFLPFSIKQQKTQIKNAKLQPKIALIRAKYKGRTDQATMRKMQEEIMELQQKEGASPLSGCLPLLIQFPFIIALYRIVTDPLHYVLGQSSALSSALQTYVTTARAAGGLGMAVSSGRSSSISLLGMAENALEGLKDFKFFSDAGAVFTNLENNVVGKLNFNLFGQNLANNPSFNPITILVLIPFIAAGFQWLSMFLSKRWNGNSNQIAADETAAQTNASMKIMDLVFPALTLWMAFSFSAMLGLYWIYQSILAILQSYVLHKVMPMPVFSEEELKSMRKAQKEAEKAQRAAVKEQPRTRSLHYIDEDDYDELPEVQPQKDNNSKKKTGQDDLPEIKD